MEQTERNNALYLYNVMWHAKMYNIFFARATSNLHVLSLPLWPVFGLKVTNYNCST